MKRSLALFVAGALTLSHATPTAAGPETAPKADHDARAKELFKKGDAAYAEARYEDALAAFQEAYELSKRPLLLFNIGNAFERLGRFQEAADTLEQYLPHAAAEERRIIEKRVENLKKRATAKPDEDDPDQDPTLPPAVAPIKKDADEKPPTLGLILVGAGGAVFATGAVLGILALGARGDADDDCKEDGGQRLCSAASKDAVDRDKKLSLFADVALGVGAVTAGVGAYILLTRPKKSEAGVQVAPRHFLRSRAALGARARPGGGEIQVVGRF